MSELLQSGLHPDADQLNAFVEQALPAHEHQQTLAHLAVCPGCRAIVALSLPEIDEAVQPQTIPAPRRPGWLRLAQGLESGVACGRDPRGGRPHRVLHPQCDTLAAQWPPRIKETGLSELASATPPAPIPSAQSEPLLARKSQIVSTAPAKTVSPETSGRSATSASEPAVKRPMAGLSAPIQPAAGTAIASEATDQVSLASPPPPVTLRSSQVDLGAASGAGSVHGVMTPSAAPARPAAQQQLSVQPPPPAAAPQATAISGAALDALSDDASSQTVTVTGASPTFTLSTSKAALARPINPAAKATLPSGLPALSTASSGLQTIALDTRNSLFFSNDGGAHWRPVPSQWKGRAVRVSATSNALPQTLSVANGSGTGIGRSTAITLAGSGAAYAPATSASLAGTITDATGAVIPAASIAITDPATQAVRTVKSDSTGHYSVSGLAPGQLSTGSGRARGFQTLQLPVTVTAAQQSLADLTLKVGATTETVTIEAATASSEIALEEARQSQPSPPATRGEAKRASPPAPVQPPLFEIITDIGDHWTSPDGQTWKRK